MLENCKSAQERWGGVSEIIDRWLNERQELLVDYCALSNAIKGDDEINCGEKLRKLCQIIVDYVSAGHFEIYEQLVQEAKELDDTDGLKAASAFYQTVDSTTEDILDFNDKYQEIDDLETLSADVSKLGEWLATRFEAEDEMIAVLHVAHKDQVA
ncbi:MAG: sigma D regulator [Marinagarivorans sp.]|nr:sigma D regulator [Marinagarivorans sp.]